MTWPFVKLTNVAVIERNAIDALKISSGTKYIGLEHIESGGRILGFQKVLNGELASTKFKFETNHILYGKLRPYLAKIALPEFAGICSTDLLPINPGPSIDRKFLAYFLRQPSMVDFAASRAIGINLPRLSPKALAEFEIPLPPLEEQKRIAAILDQADALRRLRQRAIDRLNTLGQAIFYEMFGEPISNPKGLPTKQLGSLIKVKSGEGLTIEQHKTGPYPVYGGNGINGWHNKFLVSKDTIVIGRVGAYCGSVHITDTESWVTDNALIVKKIEPGMHTSYLASALKYANLNQYAGRSAQPLISGSRIYPIEIIVPCVSSQKEFYLKLRSCSDLLDKFNKNILKLNNLFLAVQHQAFRGEL